MLAKNLVSFAIIILELLTVEIASPASLPETITEVINYALAQRSYVSDTVRLSSLSNDNLINELTSSLEDWATSYDSIPIVRDSGNKSIELWTSHARKNHSISRYRLFNFITVLEVRTPQDIESFKVNWRRSMDPRRDFVLFLSSSQSDDQQTIHLLTTLNNKIRKKIVIDVDDLEGIWVDPLVFTGAMTRIPTIWESPVAPSMGENLRGRTIIASAPETPPFNFKSGEDKDGNAIVDGTILRIFTGAAAKFNYTADVRYEGLDYGTFHKHNNSWTGQYGRVHYEDSGYDAGLIISSELLWTQTDVAPIATSIDMIFGIANPIVTKHWYAFLLPFDPSVWFWTCVMFVAIGIVQGIVMYIKHGCKLKRQVIDATWIIPYAMSMEQGLQDIPKGVRYFSLILLWACTVLGTGYKSTLRTHLMFPKPDPIPTTFDELADRTDYAVSVAVYGELEKHFWATSEVRAVKKIRDRLKIETDWALCYRKAFLSQKQACVSWIQGRAITTREMTLSTQREPMVFSKDAAIRKFVTIGFQENSIYSDSFARICDTPASMGIVKKWEEEIWHGFKKLGREKILKEKGSEIYNKLAEMEKPQEDAVPLELGSLYVVIGFIPAGAICGFVALICERSIN